MSDDQQQPGAMQRLVDRAMADPVTRAAFEEEQARLARDPAARYEAAGLVPPTTPDGVPARDPALGEALTDPEAVTAGTLAVQHLVEDTVQEYMHLVRAEPDHPLFARLASPSDEDRAAMGRLVYTLAMLAGVYAKAPTIDVHSLHRDVKRLVRGRPWLRSMAYDYLNQVVDDPAIALNLKTLVDA